MVYVDNICIIGNNESYIAYVKYDFKKGLEMIDMGHIHYYLGVEVIQNSRYTLISQRKYIGELLNKFGMIDCNPLSTPMGKNLKLKSIEWNAFEDATKYRKLVGSLIYLTTTISYILFVVGILSWFIQKLC